VRHALEPKGAPRSGAAFGFPLLAAAKNANKRAGAKHAPLCIVGRPHRSPLCRLTSVPPI
jgi:hypothetical protein